MKLRALFILFVPAVLAAAPAKVTYEDHVRPILKARCFKCHSDDEQKGELNLQSYAAAMKGGSSGAVVLPAKPNTSILYQAITHGADVEKMPPKSDKIPDGEIETIRQWILAGLAENSGSKTRETTSLDFKPTTTGKPAQPAMPVGLPAVKMPVTSHPHPVTALAASPWAPLIAVAGHECVKLIHAETQQTLGVLPFPEGIPFVLRFSRDGALLLVAGGKPVESGKVVLFDVKTGKRLASYGDETDVVLAADISADGSLVALGGPAKIVKVFRTKDGKPAYQIKKHTDWITALEFSPDGRLLATADRAGGIHLWDAATGGIALSLSEHKDGITSLSWRADNRLLASASEDGSVIVWDAKDGWPAATLSGIHVPKLEGTHYGKIASGVLSVAWTHEGNLLTVGRDRAGREWTSEGKSISESATLPSLPLRVIFNSTVGSVCIGDTQGGTHLFGSGAGGWQEMRSR